MRPQAVAVVVVLLQLVVRGQNNLVVLVLLPWAAAVLPAWAPSMDRSQPAHAQVLLLLLLLLLHLLFLLMQLVVIVVSSWYKSIIHVAVVADSAARQHQQQNCSVPACLAVSASCLGASFCCWCCIGCCLDTCWW